MPTSLAGVKFDLVAAALVLALSTAAAAAETVVAGLSAPVEIVTDRSGIVHITANSIPDAFFGQGYAAASQRLWQVDLAHRRGLGRMAAAFGPAFVPYDLAARTVLYRGDLDAAWRALDPRLPPIARAFVAGVNARVREVRADPASLPPEFVALGVLPEQWSAEDFLVARYQGGGLNVASELRRARLACAGALDADAIGQVLQPEWTLAVPAGLDPCDLHADDLALVERLSGRLPWDRAVRHAGLDLPPDDSSDGSNAWVIAPRLTETGRPILANDPHLPFSVPGPRFMSHLRAPGLDAIGAGPAGRPGFMFGHTDRIAFGRTNFNIDQEDLVVLKIDPSGKTYRGAQGGEPITRVVEAIAVRGGASVSATIATTSIGPIVAEGPGRGIALRSAWLLPGPPAALEYPLLALATDWASFRVAVAAAVTGSNYMYADIDGNIGWQAGGRAPRRRSHDGLMPTAAEHGDGWDGIIPIDELPGEFNPERGWIASANQMPFPPEYPIAERRVGFEWVSDDRFRRISSVLAATVAHRIEDSVALQHDTYSLRAEALRPLLERVRAADLAGAVATLRGWDGRVAADSKAAALYEFWSAKLQSALARRLVPKAARGIVTSVNAHLAEGLLLAPDARLGADPVAARDAIVETALREAAAEVDGRDWGSIHRVDLRHQLSRAVPGLKGDVAGLGSGGDGTTVMARWWSGLAEPHASGGAMFAAVIDVGHWAASRFVLAPGQSGDPRSPHYADGYAPWLAGRYAELPYGSESILVESRVTLVPAK